MASAVVPFVREGVERGEPTMVAMPPDRLDLLRADLGTQADDVTWVDMVEMGRNPARIIPAWREFLAEHDGEVVRGVGEPAWAGRSEIELAEAALHESLLNVAFEDGPPLQLLCPYDAEALPLAVLTEARRTHPEEEQYAGHQHAQYVFTRPLPAPPRGALGLPFEGSMLATVRHVVRIEAERVRLHPSTADDLVLAVHELAANSVQHGGGSGSLLVWDGAGSLVVEVQDRGHIDDVLVGRGAIELASEQGRGVWLANQLCDLVQVRSGSHGTQVRVHTWL
jgi:anti-sigma regulatory factor (Ser/Thr protein kinase)